MSRVTVLLPLVPEIDTIGIAPVGVADPCRRRRPAPPRCARSSGSRRRSCAPVSRAVRDGETSRSARASAASVRVCARSAPIHGKVTIQWPGSDERWTASPPRPSPWSARSRRIQADDRGDGVGPVAGRDGGAEADQRVAARVALAVPGPPPADGDLELDHRLEPVDIGPSSRRVSTSRTVRAG